MEGRNSRQIPAKDINPDNSLSSLESSISTSLSREDMDCFNLPIPGEGGLLYKLKAIGLKVGK
jgi:hypothetical protein